eukprot:6472185-Lingulodinium_polyedra.AAC.1
MCEKSSVRCVLKLSERSICLWRCRLLGIRRAHSWLASKSWGGRAMPSVCEAIDEIGRVCGRKFGSANELN